MEYSNEAIHLSKEKKSRSRGWIFIKSFGTKPRQESTGTHKFHGQFEICRAFSNRDFWFSFTLFRHSFILVSSQFYLSFSLISQKYLDKSAAKFKLCEKIVIFFLFIELTSSFRFRYQPQSKSTWGFDLAESIQKCVSYFLQYFQWIELDIHASKWWLQQKK